MVGVAENIQLLFPGYQSKIWMRVPSKWKQHLISYWNRKYDAEAYKTCVVMNARMKQYHQYIADPLKPSSNSKIPSVDYKRQAVRGTLVEGTDLYLPMQAQNRLMNYFEPFTEEETKERSKFKFQSLKFYLAIAIGASLLNGYIQRRPIAWCSEQPPAHPPSQPFWFKSVFHSHDIPSVRRGYEVYRKVCATCHSMELLHFRHLVNEVLPEKRVKQLAASFDFEDGPDATGEMFMRPGIPSDPFPKPYPNEEAARYANGGAIPPDLSVISAARHNGPDYIFALLTGYRDSPEGIELRPGLYYNTYFPGGAIAMPPPLLDEMLDYEDGTPCNVSQMSKDVVNFLTWATEPSHDERKLEGLKAVSAALLGFVCSLVWYRFYWSIYATRRIDFGKLKYL